MDEPKPKRKYNLWRPTAVVYEGRILGMDEYTSRTGISAKTLSDRVTLLGWSDYDAIHKILKKPRVRSDESESDKLL